MQTQRIILTPAPGAVFLRIKGSAVEMVPGEALRLRAELDRCIQIALAARDGSALLASLSQ